MKLAVKTLENKAAGDITLDKDVFGIEVRGDIMQRMVNYQLAKRRAGTHKTKTISEVSGTGKKPFAQKGTGNARAGSLRRNIDRGGATMHGPVNRSHAIDLPKKLRALALKSALSAKAKEGKLIVVDDAKAKTHKTKDMAKAFAGFGFDSAVIVTGEEIDANFARATNNIPRVDVLPSTGANVYDILRRDTLVLTKEAVESLTKRLK
jgi:large subunit ribosomal protein L4